MVDAVACRRNSCFVTVLLVEVIEIIAAVSMHRLCCEAVLCGVLRCGVLCGGVVCSMNGLVFQL